MAKKDLMAQYEALVTKLRGLMDDEAGGEWLQLLATHLNTLPVPERIPTAIGALNDAIASVEDGGMPEAPGGGGKVGEVPIAIKSKIDQALDEYRIKLQGSGAPAAKQAQQLAEMKKLLTDQLVDSQATHIEGGKAHNPRDPKSKRPLSSPESVQGEVSIETPTGTPKEGGKPQTFAEILGTGTPKASAVGSQAKIQTPEQAAQELYDLLGGKFSKDLRAQLPMGLTPEIAHAAFEDVANDLLGLTTADSLKKTNRSMELNHKLAREWIADTAGKAPNDAVGSAVGRIPNNAEIKKMLVEKLNQKVAGASKPMAPSPVPTVPPQSPDEAAAAAAKAATDARNAKTVADNMKATPGGTGATPPGSPPPGEGPVPTQPEPNKKMWDWLKNLANSKAGKVGVGVAGVGAATWLLSSLLGQARSSAADRKFDAEYGPSPSEVYLQQAAAQRDQDQQLQLAANPQLQMLVQMLQQKQMKKAQSAAADIMVPGRYSVDDL